MIVLGSEALFTFSLLTLTMLSNWVSSRVQLRFLPLWGYLFTASCLVAYYFNYVEILGIIYLALLCLVCFLSKHKKTYIQAVSGAIVILMVITLFTHSAPFFSNPLVFDRYYFSQQSTPYTQYWNFDKAAAGLILLGFFGDICVSTLGWKTLFKRTYAISVATVVITIILSLVFKLIKLDVTLISTYFIWGWANLFFTCLPEEMLFRGFLQKRLLSTANNPYAKNGLIIFVGALFGLAHFGGGLPYVILASIAGIGYGYAYFRSSYIESAIATHFLLNSVHFLFFTYPMAT